MKPTSRFLSWLAGMLLASAALADPLGTAFNYIGSLSEDGRPAQGIYDFHFAIYDAATGGNSLGGTNSFLAVPVSNGLFRVALDFGRGVFTGDARWLEVAVRSNGLSSVFTLLMPRQPVTPSPYALSVPGAGDVTTAQLNNASNVVSTTAAAALVEFLGKATNLVTTNLHAEIVATGTAATNLVTATAAATADAATNLVLSATNLTTSNLLAAISALSNAVASPNLWDDFEVPMTPGTISNAPSGHTWSTAVGPPLSFTNFWITNGQVNSWYPLVTSNATYYLTSKLSNTVQRFGANVHWSAGSGTNSPDFLAMISHTAPWPGGYWFHLGWTYVSLDLDVTTNGVSGFQRVLSVPFFPGYYGDGTQCRFEVEFLGNNSAVLRAGTNEWRVNHPLIDTVRGPYVTYERYNTGITPNYVLAIESVWAGDRTARDLTPESPDHRLTSVGADELRVQAQAITQVGQGQVRVENRTFIRTLPPVIGYATELGAWTNSQNGYLEVSMRGDNAFRNYSQGKSWHVPCAYHGTAGAWQRVRPLTSYSHPDSADVDLYVNMSNNVCYVRLQRATLGQIMPNAICLVAVRAISDQNTSFGESSAVSINGEGAWLDPTTSLPRAGGAFTGDIAVGLDSTNGRLTLNATNRTGTANEELLSLWRAPWGAGLGNVVWRDNNGPVAALGAMYDGANVDFVFNSQYAGDYKGPTNETMRIQGNGLVGVNTNAPKWNLHVRGTNRADYFVGDGRGLSNVSLSAIQGLQEFLAKKDVEIRTLNDKAARVEELEKRLAILEQLVKSQSQDGSRSSK